MTQVQHQADWFPVDAAKTLSHQDLLGLKLQEIGAFWMLRLFCWKDGSIPSSPKRLAVLCRSTPRQMERMLEALSHFFEPHPHRPDRLIMPMVEEDRPDGFSEPWSSHASRTKLAPPAPTSVPAETAPEVEAEVPQEEVSVAVPAPPAKQCRVNAHPKPESRDTVPSDTPPSPLNAPPSPLNAGQPATKKMSFFQEQESVFDAHEHGLCALSEARGELDRLKPERHYRMKASRRRAVAAAIQDVGVDVARQAARNLCLHVQDANDDDGLHPLDIERAFRDPERLARLFQGPDEALIDAIREHALTEDQLVEQVPAPWQPPPESKPSFDLLVADQPPT